MSYKKCEFCKKEFYAKRSSNRFCSKSCSAKHTYKNMTSEQKQNMRINQLKSIEVEKIQTNCMVCGKPFYKRKKELKKCCSKECANKSRITHNKYNKKCAMCGNIFFNTEATISKRKFCSKTCSDKAKTIKNHIGSMKGSKDVYLSCEVCDKEFILPLGRYNRDIKRNKSSKVFCSLSCRTTYQLQTQAQNTKRTSIETIIENMLVSQNIPFIEQHRINMFVADFALPKTEIIIECDGDYWHSLPNAKERDKRKDKYLKSKGWKVIRFSETSINTNLSWCLSILLHELNLTTDT